MYDDVSEYLDYQEFRQKYENEYYLNYRRKFPTLHFLDYLIKLLNAHLMKKLEFEEILKRISYDNIHYDVGEKTNEELSRIILFLDQEIKIQKSKNEETGNAVLTSRIHQVETLYPESNIVDVKLLKYLSDNWNLGHKNFTSLTKYNHIYRFFNNDLDYNIEHRAYKKLIKKMFGFDYGDSEIKGETPKHIAQLQRLSQLYKNLEK